MKFKYVLVLLLITPLFLHAQPYIDVAAIRYQQTPDAGVLRRNFNPNEYRYAQASLNLPVVFKDSSVLVVSPAVEWWRIESPATPLYADGLLGLSLPIAYVVPFSKKWTGTFMLVQRVNDGNNYTFKEKYQAGGAMLLARKKSETLTYKFGLYYNREFFGHFLMPLAGIDWQVSPKLRLFGVLPGNMVLEKKASNSFYYGASFRATTTSYRVRTHLLTGALPLYGLTTTRCRRLPICMLPKTSCLMPRRAIRFFSATAWA